ncbi:MAG: LemA family protein [Candidatus Saccharibacteria bacterium]|jgi:LemA protein|nr:LemA family protein [Candidatus Saccharibacteria bacterium]
MKSRGIAGVVLLVLAAIVGGLVLIGILLVGSYNGLVRQSTAVDAQWKQVEVQYQRRLDLIPNLVESVKGAQAQEQKVFSDLANARSRYAGANTPAERVDAANNLESSLARLLVVVENYPELRSNQNVIALMDELSGTENRVSVERRRYNEQVRDYNTAVSVFPRNILAGVTGFKQKPYFEADAAAADAPTVRFTPTPSP